MLQTVSVLMNRSEEMDADNAKVCADTLLIDSADGKIVRQVTLPRAEDEQPSEVAADATLHVKRSLFGTATQQQEQSSVSIPPYRYDKEIPEAKRVKRRLDYELNEPDALFFKDKSSPPDSRASTPTLPTQDAEYSQSSTVSEPPASTMEAFALQVVYGGDQHFFVRLDQDFSIGRYDSNNLSIFSQYVSSHEHCVIRQMIQNDEHIVVLHALARNCWIAGPNGRWNEVEKGTSAVVSVDQRFRLVRSPKDVTAPPDIASTVTLQLKKLPVSLVPAKKRFSLVPMPKVVSPSASDTEGEFECCHVELSLPTSRTVRPGSASFDCQYKVLLEKIRDCGYEQSNKKGPSRTLGSLFGLEIDLTDNSSDNEGLGKFLLPSTTLRSLYGLRSTIVEAIFYLRGEAYIDFLQKHKCHFWDQQADETNFIGLGYGLLTNFPQENDKPPINQLETKVIAKLVKGESSRNMVCVLLKPGERTYQEACTASVQFSVNSENGREVLDMTVNQRSSDVILGLPHDVCCWSIILHLVRREVRKRCGRVLAAGRVFFVIAAGGAHVYDINKSVFEELLQRQPIQLAESPELIVETNSGMFEMAQNFEASMVRVKGYSHSHHPAIHIKQAV